MATSKQIKLIHIAKGQLGLPDEVYRDMLFGLFKAESSKDLTPAQADTLIDEFKARGFQIVSRHPRPPKRAKGKNVVHLASQKEIDKLNAVASLIRWKAENGLALFLEKRVGIKGGKVRTAGEAYRAIEALKKYFENTQAKTHGSDWWLTQLDDPDVRRYIRNHCPAEYADGVRFQLVKRGLI